MAMRVNPLLEVALIDPDLLPHATAAELAEYERVLELQAALRSPLDYALHTTPSAEAYEHIKLLNEYLVALFEGRLYKDGPGPPPIGWGDDARHPITGEKPVDYLAISMPPRHGKSFLVSEHLPAWFLSRYPEFRLILASYEADFAAGWGRKARNLMEAHPEFGIKVSGDSRAADLWNLEGYRGGMKTAGAGGAITGEGGHAIIVDDPLKNSDDARSKTIRDKQKDWWVSTLDTRREPYPITGRLAPILLMATRWHEDDLIGWTTNDKPEQWCVLNLPALALDPDEFGPDPLGREEGEALCPARYTAEQLIYKREVGDEDGQGLLWFNALYQGRPTTDGTGIFRRPSFLYYTSEIHPNGTRGYTLYMRDGSTKHLTSTQCFRFQTIDLAASTKTSADWTVISTWDVTPQHELILVDRMRKRMESADHGPTARAEFKKHLPRFVGVDEQTYGLTLMQHLLREGIPVRKLKNDKDKVSRAIPAGDMVEMGRVFFPRDAVWLQEWEDELVAFDNGTYDDQVDTISYAVEQLHNLPMRRERVAPPENSLEEKIKRHMEKMDKRRKSRGRHPEMGRV